MTRKPITRGMDALLVRAPRPEGAVDLLLRHCLALGDRGPTRPSVKVRLEEALGPELARRLVTSLTAGGRR
jgi:hypothetical protein